MEILILLVVAVVLFGVLKTVLADPKTKLLRRIWTATWVQNSASASERQDAFNELFSLYNIDFLKPESVSEDKIVTLLIDAAKFDQRYPNNRNVYLLAEVGNELRMIGRLHGEEISARVESGFKAMAARVQSGQ